jgi:hypothetical protein
MSDFRVNTNIGLPVKSKFTSQKDEPHLAAVTYNNQDSVLMSMQISPERFCVLHDNRIYGFQKNPELSMQSSITKTQNLMLYLLTMPKYRVMRCIYLIFTLFDNSLFLFIVALNLCTALGLTKGTFPQLPNGSEKALFTLFIAEFFYDVMLYTHKFWTLQRLSLYIGLYFYLLYYGLLAVGHIYNLYDKEQLYLMLLLVSVRLMAFICEEFCDVMIDLELHNDILGAFNNATKTNNTEKEEDTKVSFP